MERANVISVTKLCVKALMETSLKQGKALQDDHPQLVQLLLVLELALKHRLKGGPLKGEGVWPALVWRLGLEMEDKVVYMYILPTFISPPIYLPLSLSLYTPSSSLPHLSPHSTSTVILPLPPLPPPPPSCKPREPC